MSLKAKIEAVIYASEDPVTLHQLVGLLGHEVQAELDAAQTRQGELPLLATEDDPDAPDPDARNAETLGTDTPPEPTTPKPADPPTTESQASEPRRLREYLRALLDGLIAEYRDNDRGLEVREIAGGFRFATKPEYHDAVRGFVRSLKPPLKLSLQALETLAVVAYKQPVTAPEISEIRGVDSSGVLGSLMGRKLVATAGRKQVIGRPILYKTTKEFLLRFGLKDVSELPSIEEFERLAAEMNEAVQEDMPMTERPTASEPGETIPGSTIRDAARNLEPMRNLHAAQADGLPDDDLDAQPAGDPLTPAPGGPGEFTGDETALPAGNVEIDGRISGVPPSYDQPADEAIDSPALDAEIQGSQELENAGGGDR